VEARVLALLSQGARFAAICEVIAALATGPDHVALIGRLLARWLADGIIAVTDAMPGDNDARSIAAGRGFRMTGAFGETLTTLSASKR
jgi:hypothetical protein